MYGNPQYGMGGMVTNPPYGLVNPPGAGTTVNVNLSGMVNGMNNMMNSMANTMASAFTPAPAPTPVVQQSSYGQAPYNHVNVSMGAASPHPAPGGYGMQQPPMGVNMNMNVGGGGPVYGAPAMNSGFTAAPTQPTYGGNSGVGGKIAAEAKKAWKKDQVNTVANSCRAYNPSLTPAECGAIVKVVWKDNQAPVAQILRGYCHDFAGFRAAMNKNMWMGEFKKLGI
eukprot:TRINITY_DN5855_c0_g1_i1.p1 TRINITY_DN5855_c0_g1~~TRINITY_DN5855_c0_g1_i1.p1  ORF type:complete len:225 (-),score=45.14 TRINITY_DN5855_c0_g1_i1:94-768(-)